MSLQATPSQTVGPFFADGLAPLYTRDDDLADGSAARIRIHGQVRDGQGLPVADAMLEFWQADTEGHFSDTAEAAFRGFARVATDPEGRFAFTTVRPGRVPGPETGLQAPHLAVSVFARGLLARGVSRLYLPDGEGLDEDPVLALVPPARRATLVAVADPAVADEGGGYRWDVVLQGENETVFFTF